MKPQEEDRDTLEMIAGSYETRDDREEQIWRAFIDQFAQHHGWHALFSWGEVECAYHEYLRAFIHLSRASGRS